MNDRHVPLSALRAQSDWMLDQYTANISEERRRCNELARCWADLHVYAHAWDAARTAAGKRRVGALYAAHRRRLVELGVDFDTLALTSERIGANADREGANHEQA